MIHNNTLAVPFTLLERGKEPLSLPGTTYSRVTGSIDKLEFHLFNFSHSSRFIAYA